MELAWSFAYVALELTWNYSYSNLGKRRGNEGKVSREGGVLLDQISVHQHSLMSVWACAEDAVEPTTLLNNFSLVPVLLAVASLAGRAIKGSELEIGPIQLCCISLGNCA